MKKNKYCINCNKKITKLAIKCKNCSNKSRKGKKRPEYSKFMINNNPFKGKHHTEETKQKISQTNLKHGKWSKYISHQCMDCKKEINGRSLRCPSCNNINRWKDTNYKQKVSAKISKTHKKRMESPANKKELLKRAKNGWIKSRTKPNKQELFLSKLIINLFLKKYMYVGNAKYFIERFNPDFVNKKDKKIIELYGDYWHNRFNKERDKRRLITYKKYGYKTLIIWEHELKDTDKVKNKIKEFDLL